MSMDDLTPAALPSASFPPSSPSAVDDVTVEETAVAAAADISHHELATQLVAKLCHDFISPAGAIISGLDLLEDPSAQTCVRKRST